MSFRISSLCPPPLPPGKRQRACSSVEARAGKGQQDLSTGAKGQSGRRMSPPGLVVFPLCLVRPMCLADTQTCTFNTRPLGWAQVASLAPGPHSAADQALWELEFTLGCPVACSFVPGMKHPLPALVPLADHLPIACFLLWDSGGPGNGHGQPVTALHGLHGVRTHQRGGWGQLTLGAGSSPYATKGQKEEVPPVASWETSPRRITSAKAGWALLQRH